MKKINKFEYLEDEHGTLYRVDHIVKTDRIPRNPSLNTLFLVNDKYYYSGSMVVKEISPKFEEERFKNEDKKHSDKLYRSKKEKANKDEGQE